jgi:hypothetical protein
MVIVRMPSSLPGEGTSSEDTLYREQWVKDRVTGARAKVLPSSFEYGRSPGDLAPSAIEGYEGSPT